MANNTFLCHCNRVGYIVKQTFLCLLFCFLCIIYLGTYKSISSVWTSIWIFCKFVTKNKNKNILILAWMVEAKSSGERWGIPALFGLWQGVWVHSNFLSSWNGVPDQLTFHCFWFFWSHKRSSHSCTMSLSQSQQSQLHTFNSWDYSVKW